MATPIIKTTCSGCSEDVFLNTTTNVVTAVRPSNGVQGRKHAPAHEVTSDLDGDDDLLTWDCPLCDYADSYDLNQ